MNTSSSSGYGSSFTFYNNLHDCGLESKLNKNLNIERFDIYYFDNMMLQYNTYNYWNIDTLLEIHTIKQPT